MGEQINAVMKKAGIHKPRVKTFYGLRHRAHERLRAVECPPDIQREIVGHAPDKSDIAAREHKQVHHTYGEGYPKPVLAKWMAYIGV